MTWVWFCCTWISSQWDKGIVTDVSFVYSCSLAVFHHLPPGCNRIVHYQRKIRWQKMFQNFAFYLWVSLFYFVNNKGMSGMMILDIFIWQLPSIYDQRWKREGKKLWEHVSVPQAIIFFFFFSKIPILNKRRPLELRAQKVEIQKFCYIS